MDDKKVFAMAVAAVFCIAAFASINFGDASDAASSTYEIYVEIVDDNCIVTRTAYVYFESDADNAKFMEAANKAFESADLANLKFDDSHGWISVEYDGSGDSACYYSNGKEWKEVNETSKDYIGNHKIGLAVGNGTISKEVYDALTPADQAHWEFKDGGDYDDYYMKKLEAPGVFDKIINYKVNLTLIDDDLIKTTGPQEISFKSENEPLAWCYAFNKAVKSYTIYYKTEASYTDGITIKFGESNANAAYVKVSGKWEAVKVTEIDKTFLSGSELDFELNHGLISAADFNKLTASEQKNWQKSDVVGGYDYMRMPSASSGSSGGSDNTVIYIVVAVVVIALIAAAAYYVVKKKNA